MLSVIIGLGAA